MYSGIYNDSLSRLTRACYSDSEGGAYDPTLTRFTSHDAFEEKYPSLTPYLYCAANPLRVSLHTPSRGQKRNNKKQ